MSMREWAAREVEIAKRDEKESAGTEDGIGYSYVEHCYDSALRAFNSLLDDDHSGMSISIAHDILDRLVLGLCLAPIEDTEDVWELVNTSDDVQMYQCKRMAGLFKYIHPGSHIEYHDVDRVRVYDQGETLGYISGLVSQVIDTRYPITMPYYPTSQPYRVVVDKSLPDTIHIRTLSIPAGSPFNQSDIQESIVPLDLYYHCDDDTDLDMEISKEEYDHRVALYIKQKERKSMKLEDTARNMTSANYKERFLAEYQQLTIRCEGLSRMVEKYRAGTLDFVPDCSLGLLSNQLLAMQQYMSILQMRAEVEHIDLSGEKENI